MIAYRGPKIPSSEFLIGLKLNIDARFRGRTSFVASGEETKGPAGIGHILIYFAELQISLAYPERF